MEGYRLRQIGNGWLVTWKSSIYTPEDHAFPTLADALRAIWERETKYATNDMLRSLHAGELFPPDAAKEGR